MESIWEKLKSGMVVVVLEFLVLFFSLLPFVLKLEAQTHESFSLCLGEKLLFILGLANVVIQITCEVFDNLSCDVVFSSNLINSINELAVYPMELSLTS